MSMTKSAPMKAPWLAAIFVIFLIWSIYSFDMPAVSSVGSTLYDEIVESHTQAMDAARIELGEDTPEEAVALASVVPVQPLDTPMDIGIESSRPVSELPLILYAYSESPTARINIEFFIRHGLHAAADFVFILNGPTDVANIIPKESNIKIVQRENDCYDIGAYAEVLTKDDLYKGYKRFIMLNASIRGPFSPYWAKGCWSDMYLAKITDEVKLVGMTANCWPTFHVQSMIWATDLTGLEVLLFPSPDAIAAYALNPPKSASNDPLEALTVANQAPGINSCFHDWISAVTAEVGASTLIKAAGYKLDVMMSAYHGTENFDETCDASKNADVLWDKEYFGTNVHPFETVFMKSNRDVDPVGLERHTQWVQGRGYSSYDFCKAVESPWVVTSSGSV
ncbi:hypothetical protein LSUE1_G002760 [Lachnellula suecica]|uniref:Uncharacterized protein n=1 Tax=Lachnellula suecica TaxID=602035 RepID=A0A8T9CE14_9HELO|nr:hypothetical protein LSUE1_G002760 [Lachnellula suecica]